MSRTNASPDTAWSPEELEVQLRAKGVGYHVHHPFSVRMNNGELTPDQVRGWITNCFYYRVNVPRKDGATITDYPDRETRRLWVQRILDHGGNADSLGGIEVWVRLGEAAGISEQDLWSLKYVVPGVRFAVDAYVNFARSVLWQEAVYSSLTGILAPKIRRDQLANWPQHYPWIEAGGLHYFRSRITLAQRDVEHGLKVTLAQFTIRAQQECVLDTLQFKLDIPWSMLDVIERAYPTRRACRNNDP